MAATLYQIPGVGGLRIPVSRSRALLFLVGFNLVFLGLETWLAHWIDRTIRLYEWIPVIAGPVAGFIVLLIAMRTKPTRAEIGLLLLMLAGSAVVGVWGTAFHWQRALLARSAVSQGTLEWLIFAPPVAGPLAFAGIALMGLMAVLHESPRGSGKMDLWGLISLQAPISKTRQLLLFVALGYAAATLSAILDHARGSFENPTVWIGIIGGAFATFVTIGMASMEKPKPLEHLVFFWTQMLLILVGVLGFAMHLSADTTSRGQFSLERMINHAPVFAPMLFANLALFGLISVLEPAGEN